MNYVDVFICYRKHAGGGAQTAKLFKKHLLEHHFPGNVWYSDKEVQGNYKDDIPRLIEGAECAVLFIDPNFTRGFLSSGSMNECITAREIVEIAKKLLVDPSFRIVTVFLDRLSGFRPDEAEVLSALFKREKLEDPEEAVRLFCQSNVVNFSTAKDDEDDLFYRITRDMLPGEYYKTHTALGNFCFGKLHTCADIILWDGKNGINAKNVYFEITPLNLPLYRRIEGRKADLKDEEQNNRMISLVGTNALLSDNDEEKILFIRYQEIDYRLYSKSTRLWDQLDLSREIAGYDYRTDIYPVPNAMGMAFMVITADNKLVFARRSAKRRIRPLHYDCSVVEGLRKTGSGAGGDDYGISDEGYLTYEIQRAFREEICADEENIDIMINGLVLDKKYGQWNFVGTIRTAHTAEEIGRLYALRDDTFEDNQLLFVPFTDLSGRICLDEVEQCLRKFLGEEMWDMALTAVYAALLRVGFSDREITEMTSRL